jgi:hypothetical protein
MHDSPIVPNELATREPPTPEPNQTHAAGEAAGKVRLAEKLRPPCSNAQESLGIASNVSYILQQELLMALDFRDDRHRRSVLSCPVKDPSVIPGNAMQYCYGTHHH